MSKTQSIDSDDTTPIETTEEMSERETGDVIQASDTRLFVIEKTPSLIGGPSIHVVSENGKQGRLATGVFHTDTEEGGTAWVSDIEDKEAHEFDESDLIAPYGDINVIGNNVSAITYTLPESTDEKRCPECGECKYGGVFVFKLINNDVLHEVYKCTGDECDTHYVHSRPFPEGDTATVHFYSRDGTEYATQISGVFEAHHTDDWKQGLAQLMNQDDAPKEVWTASEMAEFINQKMDTSGEAERFGVAELGGGIGKYETRKRSNAPTWWDDENSWDWVAKVQFVSVSGTDDVSTID